MSSLPLHHPLETLRAHRFSANRKHDEPEPDARTAAARRARERDRDRAATSVPPPRLA